MSLTSSRASKFIKALADMDIMSTPGQVRVKALKTCSSGSRPDILEVILETQQVGCTDLRNAIYSKTPLASNENITGTPDYMQSVNDIFTQFAMRYIEATD